MPAPDEVRTELADILATVQGCSPDAVQADSRLKDLGVDSITIVEIGEELGRRFNLYLSDETIDGMITVKDAVNAVVRHDGASAPSSSSPPVSARFAPPTPPPTPPAVEMSSPRVRSQESIRRPRDEERLRKAGRLAVWMGIIGAGLGVLIGMGSAAVIGAAGLGPADLPPLSRTTTEAPTATPTPTPTPTATGDTFSQEPTFQVSNTRVPPGERFTLEGAFPALGAGATLQVQVKDPGGEWDDFPVDTKTKDGGTYKTQIYTSRTGKREFRMFHEDSNKASPSVAVEIG